MRDTRQVTRLAAWSVAASLLLAVAPAAHGGGVGRHLLRRGAQSAV